MNLAKTGSELATIGVLAESTVLVPVATRQATPSTDRTLLAGTTLLSWFCIWLK